MTLAPGGQFAHYRIAEKIGEGGMGVVWKAVDTNLDREVALKVLPEGLSAAPDRLARFEREAKLLASLNHPNIAGIYGLHETDGLRYLAMELVHGESLAARVARGPLPLDEAVGLAIQIADALEAAHASGIIHRDLKPANIQIGPGGQVKVLDFGLAKAMTPDAPQDESSASMSPTVTSAGTLAGVILGTAAYMSPEQAKGGTVDKRADIWAFGVVLYEMLTGKRLIEGGSMPEVLGSLFRQEITLEKLPPSTPPAVRRLLARSLTRDPKHRLRDMGDARLELESVGTEGSDHAISIRSPEPIRPWLPLASFVAGAVLIGLVFWWTGIRSPVAPPPVTRFGLNIGMPIDAFFGLAVSPDGRRIVYRARDENDAERLHVRSLDALEPTPLPGADGWLPFFSPDGGRIGFITAGELMVVSASGGSARSIASVGGGSGATWLPDDTIIFTQTAGRHLYRVPASGGAIEVLEIESSVEGDLVASPFALPDGQAVLCNWGGGSNFDVALYDIEKKTIEVLVENGFTPTYVETGHILYQEGADGPLMALPFDAARREVTGSPFPIVEDLGTRLSYQVRMFAVGGDTLAYVPSGSVQDSGALVWVDRTGQITPIVDTGAVVDMPRLSHDGERVAFRKTAPHCDVWVHDLRRGATSRVTLEGDNHGTTWSPDDRSIILARNESPEWSVLSVAADGAQTIHRLTPPELPRASVSAASSDGRYILVSTQREETGSDIDLVDVAKESVTPLLRSRFQESAGVFSPDGRMLAYTSDESGRGEVYIQTFPALDHRLQVSTQGGTEPVWSATGKELFFRKGRTILIVSVESEGILRVSRPSELFEAPSIHISGFDLPSYDVSADGERFVMVQEHTGSGGAEVHVVGGWIEALRSPASGNRR